MDQVDNNIIHIHKPKRAIYLLAVMIPGVVFVLTLLLYMSFTAYSSHKANYSTSVLGASYK